ncbi:T9SS type A sorting domain-containing protein [Hymenobacter cellulosilyticus]|uniref:T9SS type A sorting domain-containing protein n=1 Tax=Hymenobacter cellulosilyticus TaxID=2932248 RepID=UPI0035CADB0C
MLPAGTTQVRILNSQGRVVVEQHSLTAEQFNVENVPNGLYQLRLVIEGKTHTQRIQIKH